MEKTDLICINCPMGCSLVVTKADDGSVTVTGNTCPRGEEYGIKEVTAPTRTVTSIVRVAGGEIPMVSVKTAADIPKEKIFDVMKYIREAKTVAPVKIGDIIIENVAGTGVNVVATKNVSEKA
ncbi:MAG: DUF1667 domain-containing protein [Eubacterium sp.]|nr:DUF1667 domain-containing protein [Eubacterium sp.]